MHFAPFPPARRGKSGIPVVGLRMGRAAFMRPILPDLRIHGKRGTGRAEADQRASANLFLSARNTHSPATMETAANRAQAANSAGGGTVPFSTAREKWIMW